MARARPYHHGDLRHALLAEAARLVESEGLRALTLRELARRLGVSHAAPVNHFADKDQLLLALAAEGFEELSTDLEAALRAGSPAARLRQTGRAYIHFALRRPGHFRVMFGQGYMKEVRPPQLLDSGSRAYGFLQTAVTAVLPPARARSAARVNEAAFFAWSTVHGAATLILDGPLSPLLGAEDGLAQREALIEQATAMAVKAIAGA